MALKLKHQTCQATRPAVRPFSSPRFLKARHVKAAAFVDLDALPKPDPESVLNGTYITLGLGALSFVGTFFVAPNFKDNFKEAVDWKDMFQELTATGGVKSVSVQEAYNRSKKGAVLLDVRLQSKIDEFKPEGAVGVPLYQPIKGWDIYSNLRRLGFSFFGVYGTELSDDFAGDVAAAVPKGKELLVICENGGSLKTKPGAPFAFQSRSLKAVYYLKKAGYNKITHVEGGVSQWIRDDLPLVE